MWPQKEYYQEFPEKHIAEDHVEVILAHQTFGQKDRHRLNGCLAQRVPGLFLASSFTMCLNCEALQGMFSWRTD